MKNKTTQELLELMKTSNNYYGYHDENLKEITTTHMKIDHALVALLAEKKEKKSNVIARSCIENHYAYQIFSGTKIPTRDKVIMLCIGFRLSPDETIKVMKITGYAPLYVKDERDNAVLFGITKQLTILEINDLLFELGLELLV